MNEVFQLTEIFKNIL